MPYNPGIWKAEPEDCSKFKTSLFFIASSRLTRAAQSKTNKASDINYISLISNQSNMFCISMKILLIVFVFCTWVALLACTFCIMCIHCPQKPDRVGSPGTGVADDCEPPYGFWESNWGSVRAACAFNH